MVIRWAQQIQCAQRLWTHNGPVFIMTVPFCYESSQHEVANEHAERPQFVRAEAVRWRALAIQHRPDVAKRVPRTARRFSEPGRGLGPSDQATCGQ